MLIRERGYRTAVQVGVLASLFAAFWMFRLVDSEFFPYAAAGMFLVLVARSPRISEIAASIAFAFALAALYRVSGAVPGTAADEALSFLGLGSSLVLAWRAFENSSAAADFWTAAILPIFAAIAAIVLALSSERRPNVYDLYLYRFDAHLDWPVMQAAARWLIAIPLLRGACAIAYRALPLMQVAVLALHLARRGKFPRFAVLVFGLAGLAGCLLYRLFPAVGPVHVFGPLFASAHWSTSYSAVVTLHRAPANSMPSLHFAWALLVLWNVPRRNRFAVWCAVLFLVLMTLATLGLGEHYFVDLVVAVPFAIWVQSTCARRWKSALLAGVITLAWVMYLRWLLPVTSVRPALAWAAIVVTLVVPFVVKLRRAEPMPEEPISSEAGLVLTQA